MIIENWDLFGAWNLDLPLLLASCDRREDAQDIALLEYLLLLPMNPIYQNDLGDLFRYFEPGQDILYTSRTVNLHLAGETTAPLREIISKCCK